MKKTVELRRHTAHDSDVLTGEGVASAVEIGQSMAKEYDLLVSSGAHRAIQTLACFLASGTISCGAGAIVDRRFASNVEKRWGEVMGRASSGDLAGALRIDEELVSSEAKRLAAALADVFESLPDGGRGLVVGHSPLHEAAVYGLPGRSSVRSRGVAGFWCIRMAADTGSRMSRQDRSLRD